MSQSELDLVLGTVDNPIRRRIIAKISEEPNYQLQLSKELEISQQLVAKHLDTMEDAGLVSTVSQDSPRGPQRKEYSLKKSFSVTLDLAPNLFRARIFSFGALPGVEAKGRACPDDDSDQRSAQIPGGGIQDKAADSSGCRGRQEAQGDGGGEGGAALPQEPRAARGGEYNHVTAKRRPAGGCSGT